MPSFKKLTEIEYTTEDWVTFSKENPDYLSKRVEMHKCLLGDGQITAGKLIAFLSSFPEHIPIMLADSSGWGEFEANKIYASASKLVFDAG